MMKNRQPPAFLGITQPFSTAEKTPPHRLAAAPREGFSERLRRISD